MDTSPNLNKNIFIIKKKIINYSLSVYLRQITLEHIPF